MNGFKFFLLLVTLVIVDHSRADELDELILKRLDPHGKQDEILSEVDLNERSECRRCHGMVKGKITIKEKLVHRCQKCHNRMPHSGLSEHMGEPLESLKIGLKGKLNCLSCHRPHRVTPEEMGDRTPKYQRFDEVNFLVKKRKSKNSLLPAGLYRTRAQYPMLKRFCTDCHKKGNLP